MAKRLLDLGDAAGHTRGHAARRCPQFDAVIIHRFQRPGQLIPLERQRGHLLAQNANRRAVGRAGLQTGDLLPQRIGFGIGRLQGGDFLTQRIQCRILGAQQSNFLAQQLAGLTTAAGTSGSGGCSGSPPLGG